MVSLFLVSKFWFLSTPVSKALMCGCYADHQGVTIVGFLLSVSSPSVTRQLRDAEFGCYVKHQGIISRCQGQNVLSRSTEIRIQVKR